jgi:peroxiredoxin
LSEAAPPWGLRQRLLQMMALRSEWYRAILRNMAVRLDATAAPAARRAGERMPPFVLPDTQGRLVASAALLARGPLVVGFVRGGWCPFCSATLSALDEVAGEIAASGGTVIAISADAAGYAAAMKRSLDLTFEILSDIDGAVALSFGVAFMIPRDYLDASRSFGIDLIERQGEGLGLLPMPATFIADRDGVLTFAHVSGDITNRPEPALLVEHFGRMAVR